MELTVDGVHHEQKTSAWRAIPKRLRAAPTTSRVAEADDDRVTPLVQPSTLPNPLLASTAAHCLPISLPARNNAPGANAFTVTCRDVAGRHHGVTITQLSDERVMLTFPPGEIAVCEPDEAKVLRAELRVNVPRAAICPIPAVGRCGSFTGTARCADAMGRERVVIVTTHRRGRVAVAAPAGGIAIFLPLTVGPFRAALRAAIGRAPMMAVAV